MNNYQRERRARREAEREAEDQQRLEAERERLNDPATIDWLKQAISDAGSWEEFRDAFLLHLQFQA